MRCNSPMESCTFPIENKRSPFHKSIKSIELVEPIFQWTLCDSIGQPSNILRVSFDWLTVGKEFWARQAGARRILFKNSCGVCAASFKKPLYPILDQNIRFPPPYFRSDPKIDNLFQTTLYPGTASVCLKINKGLIFLTYTSQGVHDKNDKNSFFKSC